MPKDKSLDRPRRQQTKAVSSNAEDWGRQFVKHLELEFATQAAELSPHANWTDFRTVMLNTIVQVLRESGAESSEIARLLEDVRNRLSPSGEIIEWTSDRNARRIELIDKWIQQEMTPVEAAELEQLTACMRAHYDSEELVPLEGARRLHRQLLGTDDSERTPS